MTQSRPSHRIVFIDQAGNLPSSLWEGDTLPTDEDVSRAALRVRDYYSQIGHDSLSQSVTDSLLVEKRSRFFGWKVVDIINAYAVMYIERDPRE